MEKEIEGGQCERERVVHPSEKSRRFVSNSPTARSRKSPAALQLQQLCASKSSRVLRAGPGPFPHWIRGSSAPRRFCGEFGGRGALGGSKGRGRRAGAEMQSSPPANVSPGPGTSRAPRGARTAQPLPRRGKGKCGARRGLGSFAQGQAAIRQPQKPGRGASHLLLSQLGRNLLLPCQGRTPKPGSEGGGGGSGGRFSSLAASRAAGVASSPPRRDSRGRPCGQARCDWPAEAGGGARRAGISKEPRILQSALEPWPARSLPRRRQAGSWGFWFALAHSLLQTTGSYMPLYPPLPLHVPMLLRQQQVRAAVCFLPSLSPAACVCWGVDSGRRPQPYPAPLLQRCPAVTLL